MLDLITYMTTSVGRCLGWVNKFGLGIQERDLRWKEKFESHLLQIEIQE